MKKNRKSLTPEEIKRAIGAIESGVPFAAVAKRFGVCKDVLQRETGKHGSSYRPEGLSIRKQKI